MNGSDDGLARNANAPDPDWASTAEVYEPAEVDGAQLEGVAHGGAVTGTELAGTELAGTGLAGTEPAGTELLETVAGEGEADKVEATAPVGAERFINRELSWLRFNTRVLEEALDSSRPVLDRVRFLSIYASNLDEFFMIRVSGLRNQHAAGVVEAPPDGMTPREQLVAIRRYVRAEIKEAETCWTNDLRPALREAGVKVEDYSDLGKGSKHRLRELFSAEIFPVLTPMAFDPGHPFPHISNLSLNLAVLVYDEEVGERFGRVKVPATIDRFVRVPRKKDSPDDGLSGDESQRFVPLEQLVAANLDMLFPGLEIRGVHAFRVTRDADFDIEDDEASDLLTAMAEVVGQRHFGSLVRLEVEAGMPDDLRDALLGHLGLEPYQVYVSDGLLGYVKLSELADLDMPALKAAPFQPHSRKDLTEDGLFEQISNKDFALYHPYDSFSPVVDFLRSAATDPKVVAIKQTLYRVGSNSPIVQALMEARENGKQVSALVELKARFDEENNIVWARALEKAGVHVTYGLVGLKTHAKMSLVVRREESGVRTYVHLFTGNYNPVNARVYSDIGYFTSNAEIGRDVGNLFNALTGYSRRSDYGHLLVAPGDLREQIVKRIEREVESHRQTGTGYLAFKMNSLVDQECIEALYAASSAGVEIDLQVRGICCLRPGVAALSETIRVTTIVGRFLEHTRMYYFRNGGDQELWLGSADLMPRNLNRRVEVLFPVRDEQLLVGLRDDVLFRHLADRANLRVMDGEGNYSAKPIEEVGPDSQADLLEGEGQWRC